MRLLPALLALQRLCRPAVLACRMTISLSLPDNVKSGEVSEPAKLPVAVKAVLDLHFPGWKFAELDKQLLTGGLAGWYLSSGSSRQPDSLGLLCFLAQATDWHAHRPPAR